MLPLVLDIARLRLVLVGNGAPAVRRLELLDEAGAVALDIYGDAPSAKLIALAGPRLRARLPSSAEIAAAQLIFLADLPDATRQALAATARAAGVIVHVEDAPELSDAHAPAVLRRGALTLAVSTGGGSPALAVAVKRFLGRLFGPEWGGRAAEVAALRQDWREDGLAAREIARRTEGLVASRGWLAEPGNFRELPNINTL